MKVFVGTSAEVASIRMSLIYWARLHAEQATWLPVKSRIVLNTTRQTSFFSIWLVVFKWPLMWPYRWIHPPFWHLWWILIGIAYPWLSFTTFVNSDSSSISPYLMIAGRPAWTLLNLSSLDDSGRMQITHISADIAIGWNLNLFESSTI